MPTHSAPQDDDLDRVVAHARKTLPLETRELPKEYFWQSLPLCVVAGVWSLGVKWTAACNVVAKYCEFARIPIGYRANGAFPDRTVQHSMTDFVRLADTLSPEEFADVLNNRHRTSTKGGILKADAVLRVAKILQKNGVEHLQDAAVARDSANLRRQFSVVPGQSSGKSWDMIWMLAGSDDDVKVDRMILRFVSDALGRDAKEYEAKMLMVDAAGILRNDHPHMTPRMLDFLAWSRESDRSRG